MTSYYEVFEVRPDVASDENEGEEPSWNAGHAGQVEYSWRQSEGTPSRWSPHADDSWGSSWWRSWGNHQGVRRYENWSWDDQGSERDSLRSWRSYANWSWPASYAGEPARDERGQGQGHLQRGGGIEHDVDPGSPVSPVAPGFDRHGNLPSGEITSIGDGGGPREPGADREGDGKKLKGKASNSYPPIFRAKPGESYRDWRRSVDFWLGGEGHQIPPEYVGPRIMVQLRDRAAQLVKHLNNSDVNTTDGMQKIFQVLERSPLVKQLDKHRVDQHRKRLMALNRFPGESLESYITRGNIYRNQLLGLDSSLEMGERFYVGHLLDHARLTRRDKALVRTRAVYDTEEAVTNAMVELAAELEGESGCPIGASEPNVAGANGEEWLVQRPSGNNYGGKKHYGKAALGAEIANDLTEEDAEHDGEEEFGDESLDGDLPPEFMEAEREAYAMHYKAKQRMAEVKKMRQYYKKGDNNEDRKKALAEKIRSTACHNCGEIGHWSRECPKAAKLTCVATRPKQAKTKVKKGSSAAGTIAEKCEGNQDHEWDLLVSLCSSNSDGKTDGVPARAYMAGPCSVGGLVDEVHDVLWCMQELKSSVILDLGCLKSVVGTKWMNQLLERWREANRWFKVYPEKEVFRFGSGGIHLEQSFCSELVGIVLWQTSDSLFFGSRRGLSTTFVSTGMHTAWGDF
eukprot:s129_g12.t1